MGGLAVIGKDLHYPGPQQGYEFGFEPWISLEPQIISRARVGQGDDLRPCLLPRAYEIGHGPAAFGQMETLCVLTDGQGQR